MAVDNKDSLSCSTASVADKHFDTIIVGGGILGAATAYYAAQRQQRVLLIERRSLMSGTTAQAASVMIRHRQTQTQSKMVNETFDCIKRFEAEEKGSTGYKETGCVHFGKNASQIRAESAGLTPEPIVDLDEASLERYLPWVNPKKVPACLVKADGYVDAYSLGMAYATRAKAAGAVFMEGVDVNALLRGNSNRVVGVTTSEGSFCAKHVVLACGPWVNTLLKEFGQGLPMAPVRSQYWITEASQRFSSENPISVIPEAKAYTRPDTSSLLFGLRDDQGAHADPFALPECIDQYAFGDDPDGWLTLEDGFSGLSDYIPSFGELPIKHYMAGVSSYTPDGKYLIGELSGLPGVLVASGCSGAGVAMSAGFGRILAELAAREEPFVDISLFEADRFGAVDPGSEEFRSLCAEARGRKR
jgi:sarcosine oxidase subunit beta